MKHITPNINMILSQMEPALGSNTCANLLESYQFAESFEEREEALQEILWHYSRVFGRHSYRKQIICPPPGQEDLKGDYPLLDVLYADKRYSTFDMKEIDWTKHAKVVGMTGAGKSRFVYKLLQTMNEKGKNWLLFDPSKREYRDLLQHESFKNIKVYTVGTKVSPLYFNPLIPPKNVSPQAWLMKIIEVITHAFFVGQGVEFFLRDIINDSYQEYAVFGGKLKKEDIAKVNQQAVEQIEGSLAQLYKDYGVFDGKTRLYPTFNDLYTKLKSKNPSGRRMLWHDSAMRCLDLLTFGGFGESLNVRHHGDFYKNLVEQRSIIEIDEQVNDAKSFIPEMIISGLFEFFKVNGKRGKFNYLIILDEAHLVLSIDKERALKKETVIEQSLRMIRAFGVGFVVIDQQPSKLSSAIRANTNLSVVFNLLDGVDIDHISRSLDLSLEERQYISMLKHRHCIVRIKDRFTNLLFCRTFDFEHNEGVITNTYLRKLFHKKPVKAEVS